ncbi:hypothetical protein RF11_04944 [Thelohanellus kitauei]|uniref:Uncharacterized protein n=1 Tax=Thelohanellus kitauei TaxID=669202 RepID=A0A0C2MSI9_THEKT|nr:hypothetical protein RF11_04944 [Thelohanellus kitauei]
MTVRLKSFPFYKYVIFSEMSNFLKTVLRKAKLKVKDYFLVFCSFRKIESTIWYIVIEASVSHASLQNLIDKPPSSKSYEVENGAAKAKEIKRDLVDRIMRYYTSPEHKVIYTLAHLIEAALKTRFGQSDKIGHIVTVETMKIVHILEKYTKSHSRITKGNF